MLRLMRLRYGMILIAAMVTTLSTGSLVGVSAASSLPPPPAGGANERPVDLDVLFIGAHPDDEAFGLATYGQWNEYDNVRTGVITITRGEGGGNAVGPEEGPALGLLREGEERRAVGRAGIDHIFNLDKVDFYYTVSAPLSEETWGNQETLEKIVRVVRETRPDVITTMNPSPTPGNHGHHQVAARLAVGAFYAAADPTVFPDQISGEGLQPWRVKKLFRGGAAGNGPTGPVCASTFVAADPTDVIDGVWAGRPSARNGGKSWAAVERDGQRLYASQGWAVIPDVPTDPTALPCDYFTLVDSRVPFDVENTSPTAMLEGALMPAAGGLPLGSELYLTTDRFDVVPGQSFTVTAHARSGGAALADAVVELSLPPGWNAEGEGALGAVSPDQEATTDFTVTVAADAAVDARARIAGTISAGGMQGTTVKAVRVVPVVRGTLQPLAEVAQFQAWAMKAGAPQLDSLIQPLLSLGVGETRTVQVNLANVGDSPQSGTVSLSLPPGFSADAPNKPFTDLAAGGTGSITFQLTNTDTSLPTANEGANEGNYPITVTTTSGGSTGTQHGALNLVPVTTVPQAATAPTVDGVESPGEYSGPALDLSRVWEGDDPESPADAAGTAKLAWAGDDLYLIVTAVDDTIGTVLPVSDAKRHWRTDSVEVAIDPLGTAANTSATFKVGAFPTTADGRQAAAYRDADARQGPIAETAPGMEIASRMTEPYKGYTMEMKIPLSDVPAAVDPAHMAMNIFIYDSDTQDKTGQTRLGWSTWGGVQGDPYRWGHAKLDGYTPPADRPKQPTVPDMPLDATKSASSPQSILQAATDGVALAGGPTAQPTDTIDFASAPTLAGDAISVGLRATGTGTAHLFVWDGTKVTGEQKNVPLTAGQDQTVSVPLTASSAAGSAGSGVLLVSFEATAGGTTSLVAPVVSK